MRRALVVLPLVLVATVAASVAAQDSRPPRKEFRVPRESPAALLRQEVGLATVELSYARPKLGGRDFAADLAALKTPWRFGANAATKLTLTEPCRVLDKPLPAGSYALFATPGTKVWTVRLNAAADQWGSYFHDPAKDVLAFDVPVGTGPHVERLTFALEPRDGGAVEVAFAWGTTRLLFDLVFDLAAIEERKIAEALADLAPKDWATRLQIAQMRVNRGVKLDEALRLLDEAEKVSSSFWIHEWRGRALHALGRTAEGIPPLEKAAELARGKAPAEYCDNLVKLAAEWRALPAK